MCWMVCFQQHYFLKVPIKIKKIRSFDIDDPVEKLLKHLTSLGYYKTDVPNPNTRYPDIDFNPDYTVTRADGTQCS